MATIVLTECPSLNNTDLTLSTTNTSVGVEVNLSCDDLFHKPSDDTDKITCLTNGTWNRDIPSCELSWEFNTQEKIIFGTSVAGLVFIIIVIIALVIAYFRCYKKRRELDEKIFESSQPSTSPPLAYNGPYNERDYHLDSYLAYQEYHNNTDGYAVNGSLDKPWLGYIPRPKVTEGIYYN